VGVYAFVRFDSQAPGKQKGGRQFLYIGKAVNIRQRVKNHLEQPVFKDNIFVPQANKIGYVKTDSEIEALLLEAGLIKKYQPKYNIQWKDNKNYLFVGISKEESPSVSVSHQKTNKAVWLGPFVDSKALKQTLRVLRKIFPYRTCRTLPKKPCVYYQLKLCPAPCIYNLKTKNKELKTTPKDTKLPTGQAAKNLKPIKHKSENNQNIKQVAQILKGKRKRVLVVLKREMREASRKQNFEKAAELRDKIFSLENIFENAHILENLPKKELNWPQTEKKLKHLLGIRNKIKRLEGYDVSNIQGREATGSMVVFEKARPDKNKYRKFKIRFKQTPDDTAMLKEVLNRRLKHPEWDLPEIMLIDGGKGQLNAALAIIKNYELSVRVIALAKKKNELFVEGRKKPVLLKNLPPALGNLILQIRDEAHRFAISYHRDLRKKELLNK